MIKQKSSAVFLLVGSILSAATAQSPHTQSTAVIRQANSQSANDTGGIPTFYAQARQVLVEVEVWGKGRGESAKMTSMASIKDDPVMQAHKDFVFGLMPPPARGLTVADFSVFDNEVAQRINYFKETDFPAADTGAQWRFQSTVAGTWGTLNNNVGVETPSATYLIGYTPPDLKPGECHIIRIVAPSREVQISHTKYCLTDDPYPRSLGSLNSVKLNTRMQAFANSVVARINKYFAGDFYLLVVWHFFSS